MMPSRIFFDDSFFSKEESIKSDVYEKDGNIIVEMESPGYTKDDINITIDKGNLTVTFEKEEDKEENKKYLHRERRNYSKVSRTFYIGEIDEEKVTANFKNGILVITSPIKKEIETKKKISIKDSD